MKRQTIEDLFLSPESAEQIDIPYIETMPDVPSPFLVRDWKSVAQEYDALSFSREARGQFLPLSSGTTIGHNTSREGLWYLHHSWIPRTGPSSGDQSNHEGINCMAAVIGASLVGIDKTDQDGNDYVAMCEQYFSPQEKGGINLFCNIPGISSTAHSMWYFLFPNMLAAMLSDSYPNHGNLAEYVAHSADTVLRMVPALESGQWFTGYDFQNNCPTRNGRWLEGDATAGVAWIAYIAYTKSGDDKYLDAAIRCMDALLRNQQSPFYEVLLPYAVTLSARMNAEIGTRYDTTRLLGWCLEGKSRSRPGWGVIWRQVEETTTLAASKVA